MRRREVVTCFLQHDGRILVLKRSNRVRTHRGKWAGVSGGIEAATPMEQAIIEIREETGLDQHQVRLVRQGTPLEVQDAANSVEWVVHPFLFEVQDPSAVHLDWEHTEYRWLRPQEIDDLDTVPRLKETWEQLWKD